MLDSAAAVFAVVKDPMQQMLSRRGSHRRFLAKAAPVVLSVLLLIGAAGYVFSYSDWAAVTATYAQIPWPSIIGAFCLMLAGASLASLRLKLIAADLGYQLSFRDAMSTLSIGHLAGVLFFQIAGQLMARGVLLSRLRIPVSGTIIVTGYERLVALAVSFALAIAGAMFLFGGISITSAEGGILIIKIILGLLIVAICGAAFVWGRLVIESLPAFTAGGALKLARSVALTLAIQIATMSAYVLLLTAIAPGKPMVSLAGASTLVMFAASLPISFAGWGVRELSAILALGTIGVGADASFAVAALIGLIALLVIGLMAISAIHHHHKPAPVYPHNETIGFDFGTALGYALPIFAATAVFFQVFVPVENGTINVNLADPAAVLGSSLFVLHYIKTGRPRWRLPHLELYVALATLLLATAFLHGLERFGWTNWAFTNRLLGWFVLLAYGATGALIVIRSHAKGLDLLLRTFVVTAASIVALETTLLVLYAMGVQAIKPLVQIPFVGFSVNKNAFGFQLLLAACVAFAARWKSPVLLLGTILVGIWFSGSRASYIALPVVLAMAAYMRALPSRSTIISFVFAFAVLAVIAIIPECVAYFDPTYHLSNAMFGISQYHGLLPINVFKTPSSDDAERIKSLIGGWTMFLAHPLFGAGLGAYMHKETLAGVPLVIHSTPLWILAEMGIIGLMILAIPVVRTFWAEVRAAPSADVAGVLLVLIITAFGVVANAHEILYQRAFWLLLGAALACVGGRETKPVEV